MARTITKDETCQAQSFPAFVRKIMAAGGLMNDVAKKKRLVV